MANELDYNFDDLCCPKCGFSQCEVIRLPEHPGDTFIHRDPAIAQRWAAQWASGQARCNWCGWLFTLELAEPDGSQVDPSEYPEPRQQGWFRKRVKRK